MPSPTWAPRFLSHFRGALFSSQRATARIGLLRPSLAHGVEPVARSGPFHGDPAPMAPRVSRCVGGSREFLGGSREWSTRSWCMLMHHLRAGGKVDDSFRELAHTPPRSVVSSFVQVSSFVEMIFFADAHTSRGLLVRHVLSGFGVATKEGAVTSRRRELPPCCRGGAHSFSRGAPTPSRAH